MQDFAQIQQNAICFVNKLIQNQTIQYGCYSFFTACIPPLTTNQAISHAITLRMLAQSLDDEYDKKLEDYMTELNDIALTPCELNAFKAKIIIGMYIKIWSEYNTTVVGYMNKSFVELLQNDLAIESPGNFSEDYFKECLNALSIYSSYIYGNRMNELCADLYSRLGKTIQADIYAVSWASFAAKASWLELFEDVKSSLGLSNGP